MVATGDAARAEFIALGDALKRLPGELFETHDHPAALLEAATIASIRVWGWWSRSEPRLPCLLWRSPRGWFATVVQPAEAGPGYEQPYWSHRIRLLELALANAIGPCPSLGLLELDLVLGRHQPGLRKGLIWGIAHVRGIHRRTPHHGSAHQPNHPSGSGCQTRPDDDASGAAGPTAPEASLRPLDPKTTKEWTNPRGAPTAPGAGLDQTP